MSDLHTTHRRTGRGALIVRVSTVAVGLAAGVGLQFWGDDAFPAGRIGMADNPSIACTAGANDRFAVL